MNRFAGSARRARRPCASSAPIAMVLATGCADHGGDSGLGGEASVYSLGGAVAGHRSNDHAQSNTTDCRSPQARTLGLLAEWKMRRLLKAS
jgi:hypothetical protein